MFRAVPRSGPLDRLPQPIFSSSDPAVHGYDAPPQHASRAASPPSAPLRLRVGLALLFLLGFGLGPAQARAEERVRIAGSGYTMPAFTKVWARNWSGGSVEVATDGTSTGPPALLRGEADIASMTRPLNDAESKAFRARFGYAATAIPVAGDALAVFVNPVNPLTELSLQQVDAIFSRERACGAAREIRRWGELGLGGDYADRTITLYGRRPGSGTGRFFRDTALCGGPYQDWMRVHPGSRSAALAVGESRFAIGFGSRSELGPETKAVAISTGETGGAMLPTPTNVYTAEYPLSRMLYFYVNRDPAQSLPGPLRSFLEYALSPEGQEAVEKAGFLPIPPDRAEILVEGLIR